MSDESKITTLRQHCKSVAHQSPVFRATALVSGALSGYTASVTNGPSIAAGSSIAALERLREGNRRFVANVRGIEALLSGQRRAELAARQQAFAIVLGCSDSRSPAEIVFDQGLGDLFVIRVAGNIVAPSQIASVESLLNLRSIVDRVRPAIEPLTQTDLARDPAALRRQCVRANVRAGANHLRHGSPALERLVLEGRVLVVGAEYDLESGVVDFFDGVPVA
jgi:carbonic anhydrase